ncbi:discoidin domain-containing protein [Streptomyces sp. NPDC093250]|uniref:discoidin domain-containing protein n=1 Tax=unclassified Streptomyces TaxID=2593676 RepID=UPI0033CE97B6
MASIWRSAKSVTAGGSHAGHPAANITDGSQLSYWEGRSGAFPQWVDVDLGGTVEADRVVLELPTAWEARTQTLAVGGGTDGSSFTSLSGSAAHRFDPDRGNTVTVDFTAREVRRIRVRVSANTGWNAAQLSEIQVYGDSPEDPPVDGTNLVLGKPIRASSTIHSFVATNANDGDLGTYWSPAVMPPTSRPNWARTPTSAASSSGSTPTPSGRSAPRASRSSAASRPGVRGHHPVRPGTEHPGSGHP